MERSQVGLLLAKLESTYGVDAAPVVATDNIAVVRGQVGLELNGEPIERSILDAGYTRLIGPTSKSHVGMRFRCELRGNRTDGVTDIANGNSGAPIFWDRLLRACDLAATYTPESSGGARDGGVKYAPVVPSNIGDSLTLYFYSEGKLYKALGCKGNIEGISLEGGRLGHIDFRFMGRWVQPVDSAIPANPTWLSTVPPLFEKKRLYVAEAVTITSASDVINMPAGHGLLINDRIKLAGSVAPGGLNFVDWFYIVARTSTTIKVAATPFGAPIDITSDGTSVTLTSAPAVLLGDWDTMVFQSLNFQLGNSVVMRDDGNSENGIAGFVIADRSSSGSINPESVTEATHPLWGTWKAASARSISALFGTQQGNRCLITAKTQLTRLNYSDQNGRRIQSADFACRNVVGDALGSDLNIFFM